MPRFYCDYCDAYLTHDSMSGRQQHMRGWKHRENVKLYYQTHFPQWAMEQQMLQMQDPQYAAMMAAGFMPPPFGMPAPDGSNNEMMMQQQAQMHMQMQLQMQMQQQQQQAGMQQQQQQPQLHPSGFVPPPIFRPPPSMAPPPSI